MRGNSSLAWTRFQRLLLVAQRPGLPKDADWADYMQEAASAPFTGALVVGEGNKLAPTQRAAVEVLLKSNGARNAVVTGSAVSRGVMIALGWFGVPVKAFSPNDMRGAFEYLGLASEHRGEALVLIDRLRRMLGSQPPHPRPSRARSLSFSRHVAARPRRLVLGGVHAPRPRIRLRSLSHRLRCWCSRKQQWNASKSHRLMRSPRLRDFLLQAQLGAGLHEGREVRGRVAV